MSKECRFSEAIEIMKTGDIFSPNSSGYGEFELLASGTIVGRPSKIGLLLSKELVSLVGVIIPAKKGILSSIEVVEACLKSNGQEREPSAFEVSLVTEAGKNRDLLYAPLMVFCTEYFLESIPYSEDAVEEILDKVSTVLNPSLVIKAIDDTVQAIKNSKPEQGKRYRLNLPEFRKYSKTPEDQLAGILLTGSDRETLMHKYGVPSVYFEAV